MIYSMTIRIGSLCYTITIEWVTSGKVGTIGHGSAAAVLFRRTLTDLYASCGVSLMAINETGIVHQLVFMASFVEVNYFKIDTLLNNIVILFHPNQRYRLCPTFFFEEKVFQLYFRI